MNSPIRFAGLTLKWSEAYARTYGDYLQEIGYCVKYMPLGEWTVVVYCHRPFGGAEVREALEMLSELPKE